MHSGGSLGSNVIQPLLLNLITEPVPKTKRFPDLPRAGVLLENVKLETITAIPYDIVKEGLQ